MLVSNTDFFLLSFICGLLWMIQKFHRISEVEELPSREKTGLSRSYKDSVEFMNLAQQSGQMKNAFLEKRLNLFRDRVQETIVGLDEQFDDLETMIGQIERGTVGRRRLIEIAGSLDTSIRTLKSGFSEYDSFFSVTTQKVKDSIRSGSEEVNHIARYIAEMDSRLEEVNSDLKRVRDKGGF